MFLSLSPGLLTADPSAGRTPPAGPPGAAPGQSGDAFALVLDNDVAEAGQSRVAAKAWGGVAAGPKNTGHADPGQLDPGHADPGQMDPGHADPGQMDTGHADPGQMAPEHADPGPNGRVRAGFADTGNVIAGTAPDLTAGTERFASPGGAGPAVERREKTDVQDKVSALPGAMAEGSSPYPGNPALPAMPPMPVYAAQLPVPAVQTPATPAPTLLQTTPQSSPGPTPLAEWSAMDRQGSGWSVDPALPAPTKVVSNLSPTGAGIAAAQSPTAAGKEASATVQSRAVVAIAGSDVLAADSAVSATTGPVRPEQGRLPSAPDRTSFAAATATATAQVARRATAVPPPPPTPDPAAKPPPQSGPDGSVAAARNEPGPAALGPGFDPVSMTGTPWAQPMLSSAVPFPGDRPPPSAWPPVHPGANRGPVWPAPLPVTLTRQTVTSLAQVATPTVAATGPAVETLAGPPQRSVPDRSGAPLSRVLPDRNVVATATQMQIAISTPSDPVPEVVPSGRPEEPGQPVGPLSASFRVTADQTLAATRGVPDDRPGSVNRPVQRSGQQRPWLQLSPANSPVPAACSATTPPDVDDSDLPRPAAALRPDDVTMTDLAARDPVSPGATHPATLLRLSDLASFANPANPQLAGHVARQIAQAARVITDQTTAIATPGASRGSTEITLNPTELGHVRLSLQAMDGQIVVMIATERPETADLMRRNIEALAQEFRSLGFQDVSFSFSGRQGGGLPGGAAGQGGGGRDDNPQPARQEAAQNDAAQDLADPYLPRRAAARTGGAGLDLRM